ncbi:hypothetical protein Agub_g4967 [Astrephomene gubernaculifera]|uniref:Phosphodiesterase n=1 Tax=Astrephomene gubernaculifera TaxID=47775 RepID=A0AAD3DNR4_9CHLO|nr:hypothetical protein Agub_g4967 [Astrephomene gubernaculifera]
MDAAALLPAAWWNSVLASTKGFRNVIRSYPSTLLFPLLLFALICGVGVWGVTRGAQLSAESAKIHAESLATDAAQAYQKQLSVPLSLTQVLASMVAGNPQYDTVKYLFNATASALASAAPAQSLQALQLVPAGVIRLVYPAEGNEGLTGVDLFKIQDAAFLETLRFSVSDLRPALDGPFSPAIRSKTLEHAEQLVVFRKSIFVPTTNPNETFGFQDSPNPLCGDACGYNATTGVKWWGFTAILMALDSEGSPVGSGGESSPLRTLASKGYRYTLTAPVSGVAGSEGEAVVVARSGSGKPHDPVEVVVQLGSVQWYLRVGPGGDSWWPRWYGGIVAVVVFVAACGAVLLFLLLVSRRRHKLLLESLLPRELIRDLQAENTDVLGHARVSKTDSPAELLVALLGCLLSGQPPDIRDVVHLRTVLQRGEDVYRPLDLGGRIKGANYDTDVARALMRQLGGATDMPGLVSYECSQTGNDRCPPPATRSAASLHHTLRSGPQDEPLILLLSTPQQREQHLRQACQSLRGALDYILLGTGEQEDEDESSPLPPQQAQLASASAVRVRRSVDFSVADVSAVEAGSDGADGLGPEIRVPAAVLWGRLGSERERGGDSGATEGVSAAQQQQQQAGLLPVRRGSGSGVVPRIGALLGLEQHPQREARSRRSSGVGLYGWRLSVAGQPLPEGNPRLAMSVRCGPGALHDPAGGGGGGGGSRRPSYVRYGSPRPGAAVPAETSVPAGAAAAAFACAAPGTEGCGGPAPLSGAGAEVQHGHGMGQGSPVRHSPRCGSPRSALAHPSGRGSAERLQQLRNHPDPAQLSRAMLMGRRGKRSSGGGAGSEPAAAASAMGSSEAPTTGAVPGGALGDAPPPQRPLVEEVERLLSCCDEWQYDMWSLQEASGGHALSVLGFFLIQRAGLVERFHIEPLRLARLLRTVEGGYLSSNPYHNSVHAADVLRTLHVLLRGARLTAHYLDPLGLLAAYFAAIVHDYGHPGLTNDFLTATSHPLALRYNDRAPLESHHAAAAFCLLAERPELDVLAALSRAERAALRKQVIEMVLATDMKQHFAVLAQFTTVHRLASGKASVGTTPAATEPVPSSCKGSAGDDCALVGRPSAAHESEGPVPLDEAERLLSLQVALKVADLGHLGAKLETHKRWLAGLEEEFFRQGDMERQLGLPISPLFDRAKQGVSKSQVGFYDFVVLPLVNAVVGAFPGAEPLVRCFEANYRHWQEVEGTAPPSAPSGSEPAPSMPPVSGTGKGASGAGGGGPVDVVAVVPIMVRESADRGREDRSVRGRSRRAVSGE